MQTSKPPAVACPRQRCHWSMVVPRIRQQPPSAKNALQSEQEQPSESNGNHAMLAKAYCTCSALQLRCVFPSFCVIPWACCRMRLNGRLTHSCHCCIKFWGIYSNEMATVNPRHRIWLSLQPEHSKISHALIAPKTAPFALPIARRKNAHLQMHSKTAPFALPITHR